MLAFRLPEGFDPERFCREGAVVRFSSQQACTLAAAGGATMALAASANKEGIYTSITSILTMIEVECIRTNGSSASPLASLGPFAGHYHVTTDDDDDLLRRTKLKMESEINQRQSVSTRPCEPQARRRPPPTSLALSSVEKRLRITPAPSSRAPNLGFTRTLPNSNPSSAPPAARPASRPVPRPVLPCPQAHAMPLSPPISVERISGAADGDSDMELADAIEPVPAKVSWPLRRLTPQSEAALVSACLRRALRAIADEFQVCTSLYPPHRVGACPGRRGGRALPRARHARAGPLGRAVSASRARVRGPACGRGRLRRAASSPLYIHMRRLKFYTMIH
jgi:hypothetical protein